MRRLWVSSQRQQPKPAEVIEIEVRAHPRGLFTAFVNGKHIATSATPLLAAARKLLEQGVPADTRLRMRHTGSPTVALTFTVGTAASFTVRDTPLRFVKRPCVA